MVTAGDAVAAGVAVTAGVSVGEGDGVGRGVATGVLVGVGVSVAPGVLDATGVLVAAGVTAVVGLLVAAGVSVGEGVLVAAGVNTMGVPTVGLGVVVGVAAGVVTAAGDEVEGQRPQVAAQYPPRGASAANMKLALHWPKFCCCWQVYWLLGAMSVQLASVAAGVGVG